MKWNLPFIIAVVCFGSNDLVGQEFGLFTEATSILRGNRALNLSACYRSPNWYFSLGGDYIFENTREDRRLNYSKPNLAMVSKVGRAFGKRDKSQQYFGIHQKYSWINLYHLDAENEYYRRGNLIRDLEPYEKQFNKYTLMGYLESVYDISPRFYISWQIAAGWAWITEMSYAISPDYTLLDMYRLGLDFSFLHYHGEHSILEDRSEVVAFQFNFTFGYTLGSL